MPDYPVVTNSSSYKTVAASTAQTLGAFNAAGGAKGDYLAGVLIVPASVSPGSVTLTDGTGSAITIFPGGTNSLLTLAPIGAKIGAHSISGAWKITTGANVTAIGFGIFT